MEERASGRVGIDLCVFSKFLSSFGLNILLYIPHLKHYLDFYFINENTECFLNLESIYLGGKNY